MEKKLSQMVLEDKGKAKVPKLLLTIFETQGATGMSRSKIYDLISRGELPVVKIGPGRNGGVRIRPQDIARFAEQNLISAK